MDTLEIIIAAIKSLPGLSGGYDITDSNHDCPDLSSELWPRGTTEFDHMATVISGAKIIRGIEQASILPAAALDVKMLDYGCGDGELIAALNSTGRKAVGYDKTSTTTANCYVDWSKIIDLAPYKLAILYDVIDHTDLAGVIEIIEQIKTVIHSNGRIFVRVHPFSSVNGTHDFSPVNLAFAHMCLTPSESLKIGLKPWDHLRVVLPLEFYERVFGLLGLAVVSKKVHHSQVNPFVVSHLMNRIKRLHYSETMSAEHIEKSISINYIDFLLAPS
jgi:hypothetical protein